MSRCPLSARLTPMLQKNSDETAVARFSRSFGFVFLANLRLDRSSHQLPEAIVRIRLDFTCSSTTGKAQNAPVLAAKARLKRSLA